MQNQRPLIQVENEQQFIRGPLPPMDVAKNFVQRNVALLSPSLLQVKHDMTTQTLSSLRSLHG